MKVELTLTHSKGKKTTLYFGHTLSWEELRQHVLELTGQRDLKFIKELKITSEEKDD